MRLDKFLAQSGAGSRKAVRDYIKEEKVSVNGQINNMAYCEIDECTDVIVCDGVHIEYKKPQYYMFNKPMGCISARKDENTRTVFDYIEESAREGLFLVGRLDKDTEGLLLITNDGEFNQRLMHPDGHINKTYFFIATNTLDSEAVRRIENGVQINEGEKITSPAQIDIIESQHYNELESKYMIPKGIIPGNYNPIVTAGYITIEEGRKHQVKRMLMSNGNRVIYLKRVAIGGLRLDENLEKGKYRQLSTQELEQLFL